MKVRVTSEKPPTAAENRLWVHIPKNQELDDNEQPLPSLMVVQGETIEVPDDLGEWLLRRFPNDFEVVEDAPPSVDRQTPVPTHDTMGCEPEVQK